MHAVLFADSGYRVNCYDSDQTVLNNLAKGHTTTSTTQTEVQLKKHIRTGQITPTDDIKKAVATSDIIVLTVPAKIDSKKKVDYSTIENMCKKIGPNLKIGSLIIIMKPLGIGLTQTTIKDAIENSSGYKTEKDVALAYSPCPSTPDDKRIVAATDKDTLDLATSILQPLIKTPLITTNNVKAAETAVLFTKQRNDVNTALSNELAMLCEKTGLDYQEVAQLLTTNAYLQISENGKEDPYLLLNDAENLGARLRVPAAARETNEQLCKHYANMIKDALKACGKTERRARVTILGITQEPNSHSHLKKLVNDTAQLLNRRGAKLTVYDPYTETEPTETLPNYKKTLTEAIEGADCLVIFTAHDQFKHLGLARLKIAMRKTPAIIDFEGIIDPAKAEKEGFIYRGFGRGVWSK